MTISKKNKIILAISIPVTIFVLLFIALSVFLDFTMYGIGQKDIIARHVDALYKIEYDGNIYVQYSGVWGWSPESDMVLITDGDAWVANVPNHGYRTKLYVDNYTLPNFIYVRRDLPHYVREDVKLPLPSEVTYDKVYIEDQEIAFVKSDGEKSSIALNDIIDIESVIKTRPQNLKLFSYIEIFCDEYTVLYLHGEILHDQSTDTYYFHGGIIDGDVAHYYKITNEQLLAFLKSSTRQI